MNRELVAKELIKIARELSASSTIRQEILNGNQLFWVTDSPTKAPLHAFEDEGTYLIQLAKKDIANLNWHSTSLGNWQSDYEVWLDTKKEILYVMTDVLENQKEDESENDGDNVKEKERQAIKYGFKPTKTLE